MLKNIYDFDKITEEYEDRLFELVMQDVAEKEGKMILEEYESYKNDPEYMPSNESIAKFTKLLDQELKKSRKGKKKRRNSRIMSRIAVAALAILVVFFSAVLSVRAFRVQVLNFLINVESKYTSVQLGDNGNDGNQGLAVNWTNAYVPTYIPDGFEITNVSNTDAVKTIIYTNKKDNSLTIIYSEYTSGGTVAIDTEGTSTVQKIKINGNDGTFSIKNDTVTISWIMDGRLFSVQGQLSQEEAEKLADSVIFKKN